MSEAIEYSLHEIPAGVAGIRQTLKIMAALVKEYKKNPEVRELALRLTQPNKQKDFAGEVAAIHKWVRDCIRYVKDVRGVETIQTPPQTLRLRAGDCDDKSILVASLLEAIGHPTRFLAVGFLPKKLSHVLVQTKIGPHWVAVETTEPVPLGWKPENIRCAMVHHNN